MADVSLLAGILTDKFPYHLPLYRQHQRIHAAGLQVSCGSLTNWSSRAIDLREPIYTAQCAHVVACRAKPGAGDGRDADQGGTPRERQDALSLFLADLRGGQRGCLPLRHVALTSPC